MTQEDFDMILELCRPIRDDWWNTHIPPSLQYKKDRARARRTWAELGRKMGFDPTTVYPIEGKGPRFFTAVPSETEAQRNERLAREAAGKRVEEIARLKQEIADLQRQLDALAVSVSGEKEEDRG